MELLITKTRKEFEEILNFVSNSTKSIQIHEVEKSIFKSLLVLGKDLLASATSSAVTLIIDPSVSSTSMVPSGCLSVISNPSRNFPATDLILILSFNKII